ncbi:hypothetical protein [Streptomyces cathayae]|uniref:hypothetical protein n=1 Tax=Streptomyces cathayae TaxID=3031124 RepID=UPI00311B2D0D
MVHVLRRLLSVGEASDVVAAAPPVSLREVFRRFWPYTRGGGAGSFPSSCSA